MTRTWYSQILIERAVETIISDTLKINNIDDNINFNIINEKYGNINVSNNNINILVNFKDCVTYNNLETSKQYDVCCVCYESCNKIMHCKHYLCYDCQIQIKKFNGKLKCPLCRKEDILNKGYTFKIPIKLIKKSFFI